MDCKEVICDLNNLHRAYLNTVKSSKWKETTQKFILDFLRNLIEIQESLEKQTYQPSKGNEFLLSERGKIRPVTTLYTRDQVIRHVLCDDVLIPKIRTKLIYDNGAALKKKGISFARKRMEAHLHQIYMEKGTNNLYGLFGDFSRFYDNVHHDIAKRQILDIFDGDPFLDWLLTKIFENFQIDVSYMDEEEFETCMTDTFNKLMYRKLPKVLHTGDKMMEKSLNIGDQFSLVVGLLYPSEIDSYVKTIRKMKYYGRYNDDFYILSDSKDELKDVLNGILRICDSLHLHLNLKKTNIRKLNHPFRYLQITYCLGNSGKVEKSINRKRIYEMRRRLKKLNKKIILGQLPYSTAETTFKSWMGSSYKIMTKQQRKDMISLFEELFQKKVTLKKKSGKWKMIITEREEEAA